MSLARRYTTVLLFALAGAVAFAATAADGRLYSGIAPLEVELDAPLARLFDGARDDPEFAVGATLAYTDPDSGRRIALGAKVEVRGNSSRRTVECGFPKLKLVLDDDDSRDDPLFAGARTVKIGTHCGEERDGDLTGAGRWANEKAPFREALVYRLLDAMDVPTLRVRPARIRYVDREAGAPPLVRNAMFLEEDDDAARRLGAGAQIERFTTARELLSSDEAARLAFAQAMIGNFDWCLRFTADDRYRCDDTKPLWNIAVFSRSGGTALPLVYDFDLAGIVTGSHPWFNRVFSDVFLGPDSRPMTEVLAQVQRTRTLFTRDQLNRTRAAFVGRRQAAYDALAQAPLDDQGRAFARAYLDAFFKAIASEDDFYMPVVATPTKPYLDGERGQTACGEADSIPAGTPVGAVQGRQGDMIQVPLLDALWHWSNGCPAVRRGPVWIDATAVTRDFPR